MEKAQRPRGIWPFTITSPDVFYPALNGQKVCRKAALISFGPMILWAMVRLSHARGPQRINEGNISRPSIAYEEKELGDAWDLSNQLSNSGRQHSPLG